MKFTEDQIEYLKECVSFHYEMNSDIKEFIIDINSQCSKKLWECASE